MPIIRLAKVNKAIELYKKQLEIAHQLRTFTKEFVDASHAFNELNREEKREMMIILGFDEKQIKEAMDKI